MEQHRARHPDMAIVSGDYVSLKVMLQGRFEHQELAVLEKEVFPRLKTRNCCLDIGANIGNHSIVFSSHFEKVIALEPNPRVFDVLQLNARWNPKITPIQMGASDHRHTVQAIVPRGNLGAAQIVESSSIKAGDQIRFECERVDNLIPLHEYGNIGFIKIDVEGYEFEALQGCESILKHAQPVLGFELLRQDHDKNADRIYQYLKHLGYNRFFEITSAGMKPINAFKRKNHKMIIAMVS